MKSFALYAIILIAALTACDPQSGMTKKGLEKYNTTPTPERTATPEEKIDPADAITVDTAAAGPNINVNKPEEGKKVKCDKYNRVMINGDAREVNIEGVCKQIMVNGDKNKVTVTAATEIVFNGHENTVEHSKYANGKKAFVTDSGSGNTITKTPPPETKKP
jgi:hypothetical protein